MDSGTQVSVDCWRFFTDGMVALARYYELDILHAHTNAAPTVKDDEWFSRDCADTLLVARKKYSGKARICKIDSYVCNPIKHRNLNQGFATYEEYKREKEKESITFQEAEGKINEISLWDNALNKLKKTLRRVK